MAVVASFAASCGGLRKAKLEGVSIAGPKSVKVGTQAVLAASLIYPPPRGPTNKPPVAWSSSDVTVASVSSEGLVTGLKVGTTIITAKATDKLGNTRMATHEIAVESNRVLTGFALEASPPVLLVNETRLVHAKAKYNDGTEETVNNAATWTSSDPTIALVSNGDTRGLVTGVKLGKATISATYGSEKAEIELTVSSVTAVAVTPPTAVVARMLSTNFTATATYADGRSFPVTELAMWESSAPAIATVSNGSPRGRATGVSPGIANITALYGGMRSAPARLTVTAAAVTSLQVEPATARVVRNTTQKLTATARLADNSVQDVSSSVTWSAADGNVAAVSPDGIVTGRAVGMTRVTATLGALSASSMITVFESELASIEVSAMGLTAPLTVPRGLSQQFIATGVYSDGTRRVHTNDVTWATLPAGLASISNLPESKGRLLAMNAGAVTVTASLMGKTGMVQVTISDAVVQVLAVSPASRTTAVGVRTAYQARALLSDGSNRDVTTEVTWSSSMAAVASISNAPDSRGHAVALAVGSTTITAALGGVTQTATLTVSNATLVSVVVTPVSRTIAIGTAAPFFATGIYSDTTHVDLTEQADWSSSATTTATISTSAGTRGVATGVAAGNATLTATFGGRSASATVTVTAATLQTLSISPSNRSVARGTFVDFTASGVFSDGTTQDLTDQVTWASGTVAVATISNGAPRRGRAAALATGSSSISASITIGATPVMATTNLTVTAATLSSIAVAPATSRIAPGTRVSLVATGTFSDSTTQDLTPIVFWSSSAPTVATVSIATGSEGEVTGVAAGSATVRALLGTVSGSATVEVTSATLSSIAVTPPTANIPVGTTQAFQATGTFSDGSTQNLTTQVTWTTSNAALAVVSNVRGSQGRATAIGVGTAMVTAAFAGVSGTATLTINNTILQSISVQPTGGTIAKGSTRSFTATGVYGDMTTQDLTASVTWGSSNAAVASISNAAGTQGVATGEGVGTATITATLGGISGMTTLSVTAATLSSIAITPANQSIAKGTTQAFVLVGTYSDNSTQTLTNEASWSSLNTAVATISNTMGSIGVATGVAMGTTTITATVGGMSTSTMLTVTAATLTSITLSLTNPSVAAGLGLNFRATGNYSDMSTQDVTTSVTWASSNQMVATISNAAGSEGRATAAMVGNSMISAQLGGVMASTTMTVTAATLSSIQVTPPTPSIAKGTTQQFTATGVYSDLSTQPLTDDVTWGSASAVASVSNAAGSKGLATGDNEGSVAITATLGGVTGSATLQVTSATLTGISIAPIGQSTALGLAVDYEATGIYTDNTTQPLTTSVTWSSNNTAVATISNAAGTRGRASTVATGSTTITATVGMLTASTQLTVTPATVASITITPPPGGKIANLTIAQLEASATYTDGTIQPVTTVANWSSADTAIASVGNTAGVHGRVTGTGVGMVQISASFGGRTGMHLLNVTNATIVQMEVTPNPAVLADGSTLAFTPTARFSDNSTQNLIFQATWASSNTSVASISNAEGSRGVATGLAAGMTNISAVWNGVGGSANLTVTAATLQSITVTPAFPSVVMGTTRRMTATGLYSDNTTADITNDVTWASSDASVSVSNTAPNKGVATGVSVGSSTISATLTGVTGATPMFVSGSTITSITISPVAVTKPAGTTQQFTATANLSGGGTQDITDQVSWGSSATTRATISNAAGTRGLATTHTPGAANIFAIFNGQVSDSAVLTVSAATLSSIAISPANGSVAKGIAVDFVAIGTFSDGSSEDITEAVTWGSSDNTKVAISNVATHRGEATTPGVGMAMITATQGMISASTTFTVTAAVLQSITITPANPTVGVMGTVPLVATANYSDNTHPVITTQATWASGNAARATVSNATGSEGVATGVSVGTTDISATFEGIVGIVTLTVQ